MSSPQVSIIGGGVTGITTGILLQLIGYRCRIHTELLPEYNEHNLFNLPQFATVHCAASVIPHSVTIADLEEAVSVSQEYFEYLALASTCAVRKQRHYEIFEYRPNAPAYARSLKGFTWLPLRGPELNYVPRLKRAGDIHGWYFYCYSAEMPSYIARLYELFEALGGSISKEQVKRDGISNLPGEVVVNCSGAWTHELFDDDCPSELLRGHLIRVFGPGIPLHSSLGECCSYNYSPAPETYSHPDGGSADVYFYPRTDAWILGGSRQPGKVGPRGEWVGKDFQGDHQIIGRHKVPAPMYELNRELILDMTGYDIQDYPSDSIIGYRFVRDAGGKGVRLEIDDDYSKPVIHNYGHGGGGVTLSWACSVRIGRLLRDSIGLPLAEAGRHTSAGRDANLLRGLAHLTDRVL